MQIFVYKYIMSKYIVNFQNKFFYTHLKMLYLYYYVQLIDICKCNWRLPFKILLKRFN